MKLFDLGTVPWKQSQLIYHVLGLCGEESIVICTPQDKYACVGFHQYPLYELDIDYCKDHGIGIFRREIGGGTVFLDNNQIFYQVIVSRESAPMDQRVLFKKYLGPIIETYNAFGINAQYNPVSDLVVNGKKISGNGGGDIGNCKVMTGSILLDFNPETMCHILNLPSEKFRNDVCSLMKDNLTSVINELKYVPDILSIKNEMIVNFEKIFGSLEKNKLDHNLEHKMTELDEKFSSSKWLFGKPKQKPYRNIKIKEGLNLVFFNLNDLELCFVLKADIINEIKFYSAHPEVIKIKLNKKLLGKEFDEKMVSNIFNEINN